MCRRLLAAAVIGHVATVATAASTQSFFDDRLSAAPCYTRSYDRVHLRAHPQQTVRQFQIATVDDDPLAGSHPKRFTIRFQFHVTGTSEAFTGLGECSSRSGGAFCQVEGDGGAFALAPDGQRLRVMLGDRLQVEGSTGASPDLARGDNRVMLLRRGDVNACAG